MQLLYKIKNKILHHLLHNIIAYQIRRWMIKYKVANNDDINLVIGASDTKYLGWISTNIEELNMINEKDYQYYFSKKNIDRILLEHVVEHIEYDDFIQFLTIVKKYMRAGGNIRIAVPDAYHASQYYRELTKVNGAGPGADDHKFFYSIDDFEIIAKQLGFGINKLEYFDYRGNFHQLDYDFKNGYISRCAKNYKGGFSNSKAEYNKMINTVPSNRRNQFSQYNISYTSLLIDFHLK